jgi:uncharacterized protein YndB with AHSA1/START domain
MATMSITPDQDALAGEIYVAVPRERVFKALTDPAQLPKWWGHKAMYRTTSMHADLRPGGKWMTSGIGTDGREFNVSGEYMEVDPPGLLVYTWKASWTDAVTSTVRWELSPSGEGTMVKILHSGLKASPEAAKSYAGGWPSVLAWMQAYVERGETLEGRA